MEREVIRRGGGCGDEMDMEETQRTQEDIDILQSLPYNEGSKVQYMTVMMLDLTDYFDFLSLDVIRVRGHRLGIEHIVIQYLNGLAPEEIAEEFPGLPLETIYAAITYYLSNRTAMDDYLLRRKLRDEEEYQAWIANPPPHIERLRAVREQRTDYGLS
jgi:uncharacterized protein (DUF433 family)